MSWLFIVVPRLFAGHWGTIGCARDGQHEVAKRHPLALDAEKIMGGPMMCPAPYGDDLGLLAFFMRRSHNHYGGFNFD